jgi:hypothetical protein
MNEEVKALLPKLEIDRERTPWWCGAGRFARPEDHEMNLTMRERWHIVIPTNVKMAMHNVS